MQYDLLKYVPEEHDPSLTIETRDLVAKVIDNTGLLAPRAQATTYFKPTMRFTEFTHHLGYHGIRTLYHKAERRNLVLPFGSWLNLQSVRLAGTENDPVDERAWAGIARGWPVRLEGAAAGARITLDPLPQTQMEYRLELQPAEPDGLGFSVRFVFHRRAEGVPARFEGSWPCYVSAYDDARLFYPQGTPTDWEWTSLGRNINIVLGETVNYQHEQSTFDAVDQALPLAYGLIGEYALIMMFSDPRIHLFLVNGGGHLFCSSVQNPAWDFSWTIDDYPLEESVGFDGRIVYTRFHGADAVVSRYHEWLASRAA
jgi:hypothetical protein